MGMCVYNNRCPLQAEYKWVKACTGNKNKAMCSVCMKSIDLSKMGEFTVKSHMQSVKHKANMCSVSSVSGLTMYFGKKKWQVELTVVLDVHVCLTTWRKRQC